MCNPLCIMWVVPSLGQHPEDSTDLIELHLFGRIYEEEY